MHRLAYALTVIVLAGCHSASTANPPTPPKVAEMAAPTPPPLALPELPSPAPLPAAVAPPLTASAPTPPPYDLAADRDRKSDQARRELGKGTSIAVVDDVFVLVGAPGWNGPALKASVDLVKNAVAAYRHDRFDHSPTRAIAVYLFATADPYRRFCRAQLHEECISPFGFYMSDDRRMIMNAGPGLGTLTHELVHPFVDADFEHAPTWINEGIASLYEAPVLGAPGEIRGVRNWRLPRLQRALASKAERDGAGLDRLFGMPDDTFRGDDEDLHYATARYVCQWLDEHKMLWPFYHQWRDHFDGDPTGEKAFHAVVGASPAVANVAWTRWVKAL